MANRSTFKVDLIKIEGEGEFPCLSCGEMIYPDDESRAIYDIIDIKTKEDGSLEEILVLCNACGSIMHLVGFGLLKEMDKSDELTSLDEHLTVVENLEEGLKKNYWFRY